MPNDSPSASTHGAPVPDDPVPEDPVPDNPVGFLAVVADAFSQTVADDAGDVLIYVEPTADGYDVGVHELEGQPPADILLGCVAPDEWVALGVAARGTARPLDPQPGESEQARRSSVVVLVHRSGQVVSRLRVGDEVSHETPAHGLTLDCLQRAFGLPSAPPMTSTGGLFAATWLENVLVAAGDRPMGLTWAQIQALHPARQLLDSDHPDAPAADLVAAARVLERVCGWERLRWMVVEGAWLERDLSPTDAAWFDTGAFSRWVLGQRPGIELLLEELNRNLPSGVVARCAAVVRRLGIDLMAG